MMNRKQLSVSLILLVTLFCVSSVFYILKNYSEESVIKQSNEVTPKYGIKGLPYGLELSKEIQLIDEKYVYYNDRILEIYLNNTQTNNESIKTIQSFMNVIPSSVRKTVAIVPMAITYENDLGDYNTASLEALKSIKKGLKDNIQWIDVDAVLNPHREEYLFFRTDPRITSIAAYHIAKEFLRTKDIQLDDLDKYEENRLAKVQGIYTYLEKAKFILNVEDTVVFYLKEGTTNLQEVTIIKKEYEYKTFKSPTIALSRRGLDVFVEGSLSDSMIYGDSKGRSIIVIGDYSAKVVSTWLIPYYEKIFVINSAFYTKSKADFFQLFKDYTISDILIVESLSNIGDSSMNSKLKLMFE